jgi:hypothetical protein
MADVFCKKVRARLFGDEEHRIHNIILKTVS